MERLLIQFDDASIDAFRWARLDDANATAAIAWQAADGDELGPVAAQNPLPAILVVPQQCVYMTEVALPEKAGRQVLAAIEFQVEDQLAQDIESQHFALGDTGRNPIAIAVVAREIMDRCLALAQQHGLRLMQILPELFLCPWRDGEIGICEGSDGYLLRYGAYRGLKCQAQALPAMLQLVRAEHPDERICYYARDDATPPGLDDVELERATLAATPPAFLAAPVIDLQQRDYKLTSAWLGLARRWRWVAALLMAVLVFGGYNRAVALQELETELAELRQQQFELARPWLPENARPQSNVKTLLIARLQEMQSSSGERGFLPLLLDFASERTRYPTVEISRIGYQDGLLNVDLTSKALTDVEALHRALLQKGVDAELRDLSIKPEQISGRLVLRGGSDA